MVGLTKCGLGAGRTGLKVMAAESVNSWFCLFWEERRSSINGVSFNDSCVLILNSVNFIDCADS